MAQSFRRLAALLNALSAGAALALTAIILIKAGTSAATLALSAALVLFAGLSALAAVGMWRATRFGAALTLLMQGLQLPQFETSPLTYLVNLPLALVAGIGRDWHLRWSLAWRPGLHITPNGAPPLPWVGANLIALIALIAAIQTLREGMVIPARP